MAGEVQKLEKQALRDFRDATDSESVASGEHGIPARASQSNIYNMAGVLRMAWISEGEMGRAVRNATMQLIHSIPAMVKQAADNGRNSQLDTISTGDLASNVIADRLTDLTMVIQSLAEKVEAIAPVSVKVEQKVDRVEEKVDIVVKKLKAEREPFRDSVKREAARIFLKIHPDGRDIFDDSLIINPKTGNPTKACDFDHFNLEGKQRQDGTIRNCAPLSRDTHRRKHGSCSDPFTVDEWQKFKNFHGAWQHQIDTEERCKPYQPGLPIEPN